ncbi:helix-turn-helix domain-containing protein [Granulicella sp. WH15]|uniref:helix-turn-helix domain-containing protein n=1 Tax=Granulicella sp. WH15 TaxID=2602070 RepID=UPI00136723DA|nr:helix-turn-helix transcriptional regulator [Granulicella sp. WH15]QHN03811.1 helix-turn-helix domain-containing protein [Granulicella sp. WH15]
MKKPVDRAVLERYEMEHDRCLGVAVREFRTDKGLTHGEVASRAKVSVPWLKKLETNELHTNYSIGRLDRIARALGLEMFDLYKRAGDMAGPPPWLEAKGAQDEK